MELYRCDVTLHDYLFFATTERGKVAETGPFLHNYALTYALGWAKSPWRNEEQQPHYREELAKVGRRYVTPAKLLRGSYVVNQYNTMSESYSLGKAQSIGYPDWGFIKCFRPGAIFRFYVISAEVVHFPHYLRLGKFMAKAELRAISARQIEQHIAGLKASGKGTKSDQVIRPMLNWDDLEPSARPIIYDIITSPLPSRLIDNPVFDGVSAPYLTANFANDETPILLPLRMGYYGENLCGSW